MRWLRQRNIPKKEPYMYIKIKYNWKHYSSSYSWVKLEGALLNPDLQEYQSTAYMQVYQSFGFTISFFFCPWNRNSSNELLEKFSSWHRYCPTAVAARMGYAIWKIRRDTLPLPLPCSLPFLLCCFCWPKEFDEAKSHKPPITLSTSNATVTTTTTKQMNKLRQTTNKQTNKLSERERERENDCCWADGDANLFIKTNDERNEILCIFWRTHTRTHTQFLCITVSSFCAIVLYVCVCECGVCVCSSSWQKKLELSAMSRTWCSYFHRFNNL